MASEELLITRFGAVAVVTLNRPAKRNALTAQLLATLDESICELDDDHAVRAIVLTGADPAFSAGIDLRSLGTQLANTRALARSDGHPRRGLLPWHKTPIIGAINGPAVTGGLELALGCDFLVASERASFADTHARVGVMPGGGMTIRLPQLVGIDRARYMSLTGNFVDAATANDWGLVIEVTPHGELLNRAIEIATSIASLDPEPVSRLRDMYDQVGDLSGQAAWLSERKSYGEWMSQKFDSAAVASRVDSVMQRGSREAGL